MTSITDDRVRAAVASPARFLFQHGAGLRGRRPHKIYVIGGIAHLAVKFLNMPISNSTTWHTLAGGVLALAR